MRLQEISVLVLLITACGGGTTKATEVTPERTLEVDEVKVERTIVIDEVKVDLALDEAGTKLEPPVDPAELPSGAWYCDMGTVHFARTVKGDGECGLCGMKLKQKQADSTPSE